MRDARTANERTIRDLGARHMPYGPNTAFDEILDFARNSIGSEPSSLPVALQPDIERLRAAMAEWGRFNGRYARAVKSLAVFEAWNLLAILASLIGFTCVSWLASHWMLFAILLVVGSVGTVAVTGGALYVMARRDPPSTSSPASTVGHPM